MMDTAMMGLSQKPKMPKGMKDARKHGISDIHIQNNHDGSHQITHTHMKPGVAPTKHSAPNLEGLHDHLEEMLGGKPTAAEMGGAETPTPPMMEK